MKKLATRDDVAREAGVSSAVVSYVLNNTKYVSEEKRKAVLKAVDALGYFPNQLARGLKTSKSNQIAFVADNLEHAQPYTHDLQQLGMPGYHKVDHALGYDIYWYPKNINPCLRNICRDVCSVMATLTSGSPNCESMFL